MVEEQILLAMGQWEFATSETVEGPRVPWERSLLALDAHKEPILFEEEIVRVNKVLAWARIHEDAMYYNQLVTVTKLNMYLYSAIDTAGRSRKRLASEAANNLMLVASNPPTANTRGATP